MAREVVPALVDTCTRPGGRDPRRPYTGARLDSEELQRRWIDEATRAAAAAEVEVAAAETYTIHRGRPLRLRPADVRRRQPHPTYLSSAQAFVACHL